MSRESRGDFIREGQKRERDNGRGCKRMAMIGTKMYNEWERAKD